MSRSSRMDRINDDRTPEIHVADVIRHGSSIVLPEDLSTRDAIDVLLRKQEQEEEHVNMSEALPVFVWDGARALMKALDQMFGVALTKSSPFGSLLISVESGVGETVQVPWGRFELPGVEDGYISCSSTILDGRLVFEIEARVKGKDKRTVQKLIELTREIALKESIYRGQAVRMRFRNDDGEVNHNAQPKFMDLSGVESVVFRQDLERAIETNILVPILYPDQVRQAGIPLKRGVLLAGPYGVGKTLLAANVAKKATTNGWTFLYCESAAELPDALQFAQGYQPCVVFVEDIDRVTAGQRTTSIDDILNTLDGVGSKMTEVITIMTTNAHKDIHPAMLRPGRIDVPLFIDPPDENAVERLIKMYGRDRLVEDADLTEVSNILKGHIPAVIREVVESSKLETLRRTDGKGGKATGEDLAVSAKIYLASKARVQPGEEPAGDAQVRAFAEGLAAPFATILAKELQKLGSGTSSGNGSDPDAPTVYTPEVQLGSAPNARD